MAKLLAPAFTQFGSSDEPMTERLAAAIERRRAASDFNEDEPTEPNAPIGTVPCDQCGVIVQRKDDHYGVHFPNKDTTKPCERSWPSKPKRCAQ